MLSNARVIRGSEFDILSGGLNNTLPAKLCQGLLWEHLQTFFQPPKVPQSWGTFETGGHPQTPSPSEEGPLCTPQLLKTSLCLTAFHVNDIAVWLSVVDV